MGQHEDQLIDFLKKKGIDFIVLKIQLSMFDPVMTF